jgi:hypothetical protein
MLTCCFLNQSMGFPMKKIESAKPAQPVMGRPPDGEPRTHVNMRLPDTILARVAYEATASGRTKTEVIRRVLEEYLPPLPLPQKSRKIKNPMGK